MKKYVLGLGALVVPSLIGAFMVSGCSEANAQDGLLPDGAGDLCGDCGTIAKGDVGISGDVRLDGFFKALSNIRQSTLSIQADFDSNVRALAALYPNVQIGATIDAAAVRSLTGAIRADVDANVQGGLQVVYQPPRCEASLDVAVDAQARCEAKADCQVNANPGQLSVACEGTCSGSCDAQCTGEFSCEVEAPSIQCEGRCEGTCQLNAAAACEGTCRGECNGTCSARDGEGNCAGKCDGTCEGSCELSAAASCSGTCTGKCLVEQGSASCTAGASCRGSCSGKCTGGCEGNFEPPSVSADCEASAKCQASAKAEANASLACTPPQLKVDYSFRANAQANARAEFSARIGEVRARGLAIVQGAAKYEALLTGKVEGRVVFSPSPIAELSSSVQGMVSGNGTAFADFDIAPGKIACVLPALREAGSMMSSMGTSTESTIAAQAEFVSAFKGGFGG